MKIVVGGRRSYIPEGDYLVSISEIREGTFGGKRKILIFVFDVVEGAHRGAQLQGFVNAQYETFTPYTKLYCWYQKALNYAPEPGEELDLDNLRNRVLRVKVVSKSSKKTGNVFSNVSEILGCHMEV